MPKFKLYVILTKLKLICLNLLMLFNRFNDLVIKYLHANTF